MTPMGSLLSPPHLAVAPPSPSPENSLSNHVICAVFCARQPTPDDNVCNLLMLFDPSINSWTYLDSIPDLIGNQVLKNFALVSIGESIFIIGGQLCQKEMIHVSDEYADLIDVGFEVVSKVLRYNIRTNQWSTCAPLNVARYDFACTVCENKIYVAGGKSMLESARGISSAEVYDPETNTWTLLPDLHIMRHKCAGVAWQGRVHVIGGFVERKDSDSDRNLPSLVERSSGEVYDMQAGRWDRIMNMWQLDIPPNQIVNVNGTLFSSGDCLNAWKGHIEAYDGNLWYEVEGSQRPSLSPLDENLPSNERLFLSMASIGSQLFFLAGFRTGEEVGRTMSIVHVFDTSANAWRSFEPAEFEGEKELCTHCCVVQLPRDLF